MAELRWIGGDDEAGWDRLAASFTRMRREAIPDERPTSGEEMRAGAVHAAADR